MKRPENLKILSGFGTMPLELCRITKSVVSGKVGACRPKHYMATAVRDQLGKNPIAPSHDPSLHTSTNHGLMDLPSSFIIDKGGGVYSLFLYSQ